MGIRETPACRVRFYMFDRNSVGGVTSVLSVRLFRAGNGKRPSQRAPALCGAGFQPQRGGAPAQHLTFWMRFLLRKRILIWRMRRSEENAKFAYIKMVFLTSKRLPGKNVQKLIYIFT